MFLMARRRCDAPLFLRAQACERFRLVRRRRNPMRQRAVRFAVNMICAREICRLSLTCVLE